MKSFWIMKIIINHGDRFCFLSLQVIKALSQFTAAGLLINLILKSSIVKNWDLDTYPPFQTTFKSRYEKAQAPSTVISHVNLLGILAADLLDYIKTNFTAVRLSSSWTRAPWESHIFKQNKLSNRKPLKVLKTRLLICETPNCRHSLYQHKRVSDWSVDGGL